MTNCCDANGECNQGRDCPVRKARVEEEGEPLTKAEYEELLWMLLFACFLVSLLLFAGWHLTDAVLFMWRLFT